MICKVCGNSENNKEFEIREMMFGYKDDFIDLCVLNVFIFKLPKLQQTWKNTIPQTTTQSKQRIWRI